MRVIKYTAPDSLGLFADLCQKVRQKHRKVNA